MSGQQVQETMEAYWSTMRNGGDVGRFYAEDITFEMVRTGEQERGRQAAAEAVRALYGKAFDGGPEFVNAVFGEGKAAVELVFVGIHVGEFAGVPATGRSVRVPYAVFYEVADGVITRLRSYLSPEELLARIQDG